MATTPKNSKTKTQLLVNEEGGNELQVPVIDLKTDSEEFTSQKESLKNTLLSHLFEPKELRNLAIVKTDDEKKIKEATEELECLDFSDGVERDVTLGSRGSIYYCDENLEEKLESFFNTDPETAFRYGSLLASSCLEGIKTFDANANNETKPLRVKIVDSEGSEAQQKEAHQFQTGDCHGKISPSLAKQLNADSDHPFQFRMAWMKNWATENCKTPDANFLAKGTFLPDKAQTDDKGYDLILDRSSIKGVNKKKLDQLIPCGDFELPKAVIGNRSNAKVQKYENSWQLLQWCSEDALRKDIVPETRKEAKKLASIQDDPFALKNYIVEQYDRKKEILAAKEESSSDEFDEENSETEKEELSEPNLIRVMRADKKGQLVRHPKIASFMRDQIAKRWTDLAIKGAKTHGSAMAQPCDDLKEGTIVAPHLKSGTEVIVTRYPIISKDNIRRYTVDNEQKPELKKYKGCAFIRPDQAMKHHQCDFDGDQLVITPASKMPNMAKEFRHANDTETDFKPVVKRPKVPYTEACKSAAEIAVAISRQNVGLVATAIGRVQTSVNDNPESQEIYDKKKKDLLEQCYDALQIEVDYPKSATRHEEDYPDLLKDIRKWQNRYPSLLFDYKKDKERLYKSAPLPAEGKNPINVIAREAVNPEWQETQIFSGQRHEFRYLMPSREELGASEKGWKDHINFAQETREEYIQNVRQIKEANGNNEKANKEGIGKLYDNIRSEIDETFPSQKSRKIAASAMWELDTKPPHLNTARNVCCEQSKKLRPTFGLARNFQRLHSMPPENTYILSVPFKKKTKDENGKTIETDRAGKWKETLDKYEVKYEATLHPKLPMVNFALIDPRDDIIESLDKKFGDTRNNINRLNLSYTNHEGQRRDVSNRITPPSEYTWLESEADYNPKSPLALNLFPKEIGERLQETDYLSKLELVGQKYNKFADVDLHSPDSKYKGKTLTFEVSKTTENSGKQRKGTPIVLLEGKELAMFSSNSPKLPPGTTFKGTIAPGKSASALNLMIDPESIQHLDAVSQQPEESSQKSATAAKTPSSTPKPTKPKTRKQPEESSQKSTKPKTRKQTSVPAKTNTAKTPAEQPVDNVDANDELFKIIKQHHENTGKIAFDIGNWKTLVNENKDFLVRTKDRENRKFVFKGNLKTGKITRKLDPENQKHFQEIKESENLPSIKKTQSSDQSNNRLSYGEDELHKDFIQLIKEHQEKTGNNQFEVQMLDDTWKISIDKTSAFQVKSQNQNQKLICFGDLKAEKCYRKLSPENQKTLQLAAKKYCDEHNMDNTKNGNMKKKEDLQPQV